MAAPNLNSPTRVEGKHALVAVGITSTTVLSNSASSNKCFRVISLLATNIDGTNSADITVNLTASGSSVGAIISTVAVPADAAVELLVKPLYLMENTGLAALASASGDLNITATYEEIT
jgi:hypothetical protein